MQKTIRPGLMKSTTKWPEQPAHLNLKFAIKLLQLIHDAVTDSRTCSLISDFRYIFWNSSPPLWGPLLHCKSKKLGDNVEGGSTAALYGIMRIVPSYKTRLGSATKGGTDMCRAECFSCRPSVSLIDGTHEDWFSIPNPNPLPSPGQNGYFVRSHKCIIYVYD